MKVISFQILGHINVAGSYLSGWKQAKMANLPRFAQVVQQESFLETSFYKGPKK